MQTVLELQNVSKIVEDKTILYDISFVFSQKQIYTILGPSGSGKSSLLRLINRLDDATTGSIKFKNENIDSYPVCDLRKRIGYLFQTPYLFETTVRDNFLFVDKNISDDGIVSLLEKVQFPSKFINSKVEKLSGGEKQRVAFARMLMNKPEVLLLDEPTSALDPTITESIEKLIKEITMQNNLITIIVTHDPTQASRFNQTGLLLSDGTIAEHGPIKELLENPSSDAGKKYKARVIE